MTVQFLIGDVREKLRELPADSVDCVVTSPPYWGLRDYGVAGQLGLEPTLGEHLDVMVEVAREIRRVMKPRAAFFLNYGDVYATKPNGRSAKDTKAAGRDDRTFRDKPFSTAGAIYRAGYEKTPRAGKTDNFGNLAAQHGGRVVGVGPILKPKDLCMVPNRLAIALQEDGWWVHAENVWGKSNPMPDSSGKYRPSTSHEKVWLLSKSGHPYYNAKAVSQPVSGTTKARVSEETEKQRGSSRANAGVRRVVPMKAVSNRALGNDRGERDYLADEASSFVDRRYLRNYEPAPLTVWRIGSKPFKEAHFATFPPDLAALCILAGCPEGGVVLDPFGGAGTTGLVAEQLGRDSILIELSPAYARMARRRIVRDANKRSAA